jgi:methyl-accepting chemotaxis protein
VARDGSVLVKFLADTLGFRKGTDDMEQALDAAAKATEADTKHMAESFRKAGDKIDKETKDIEKGTKSNLKDAGKETGAEFIANMGEGIGSGAPNLQDTVLGTIGGIAPALGAAGVGIAIGATAILGIIDGMNKEKEKVKQAAADLFESMRTGIIDASAREDLLQKALGVESMMDALAKVRGYAERLGAPVKDVLAYLESAGKVATPALTAALKNAEATSIKIADRSGAIHLQMSDAGKAAKDLKDNVNFTADAYKTASDNAAPLVQQAKDLAYAMRVARDQADGYADAAYRAYLRGDPRFGGKPGGVRK